MPHEAPWKRHLGGMPRTCFPHDGAGLHGMRNCDGAAARLELPLGCSAANGGGDQCPGRDHVRLSANEGHQDGLPRLPDHLDAGGTWRMGGLLSGADRASSRCRGVATATGWRIGRPLRLQPWTRCSGKSRFLPSACHVVLSRGLRGTRREDARLAVDAQRLSRGLTGFARQSASSGRWRASGFR